MAFIRRGGGGGGGKSAHSAWLLEVRRTGRASLTGRGGRQRVRHTRTRRAGGVFRKGGQNTGMKRKEVTQLGWHHFPRSKGDPGGFPKARTGHGSNMTHRDPRVCSRALHVKFPGVGQQGRVHPPQRSAQAQGSWDVFWQLG